MCCPSPSRLDKLNNYYFWFNRLLIINPHINKYMRNITYIYAVSSSLPQYHIYNIALVVAHHLSVSCNILNAHVQYVNTHKNERNTRIHLLNMYQPRYCVQLKTKHFQPVIPIHANALRNINALWMRTKRSLSIEITSFTVGSSSAFKSFHWFIVFSCAQLFQHDVRNYYDYILLPFRYYTINSLEYLVSRISCYGDSQVGSHQIKLCIYTHIKNKGRLLFNKRAIRNTYVFLLSSICSFLRSRTVKCAFHFFSSAVFVCFHPLSHKKKEMRIILFSFQRWIYSTYNRWLHHFIKLVILLSAVSLVLTSIFF